MVAKALPEDVLSTGAGHPSRRGLGLKFALRDAHRSFAKLAHRGRAALEQIQITLGHASIQTTERYLGVRQDLSDAPCDYLGPDLGE